MLASLRAYASLLRRNAAVRNLWIGQTSSTMGDWFASVALVGLIVDITGNVAGPVLNFMSAVVPHLLGNLFISGYVADRFDRKRVMLWVDVIRGVVSLALLLAGTPETIWIGFAVHAVMSLGTSIFEAASGAAMPNLVDERDLPTVAALSQTTFASMTVLGATLGGMVAVLFGRNTVFVFNALTFFISLWFIWRTVGNFNAGAGHALRFDARALAAGARFVFGSPRLRRVTLLRAAGGFTFAVVSLYGVFGLHVFGLRDIGTSLLYAARGVGSFLGPLFWISRVPPDQWPRLSRALPLMTCAAALCHFLLAFSPAAGGGWASGALGAIGTFAAYLLGLAPVAVLGRVYLQRNSPDALRGRVLSTDNVLFTLTTLFGTVALGALASAMGAPMAVGIMASVTLLLGLGFVLVDRRAAVSAQPP